jgi:tRNA-dihydrouridine synthase
VIKKHLHKSVEWKGDIVGILEMRRHYANYLKGLPNIKEYRSRLVILDTPEEIEAVLAEVVEKYSQYTIDRTPIELINYHEKCKV